MKNLKNIFFLPENKVIDVNATEKDLCINIRPYYTSPFEYRNGAKAVLYIADGMPVHFKTIIEQLEYLTEYPDGEVDDKIQKVDTIAKPVADFIKEHIGDDSIENIYVNCVLGESRSYAVACAIKLALRRIAESVEVLPLPSHKLPEYAYTNDLLESRTASHIRSKLRE